MPCGCPTILFSRDQIICDPNENQSQFFVFPALEPTEDYDELWWTIKMNLLSHPSYIQRTNYQIQDVPIRFNEIGFITFGVALEGDLTYWLPELPIMFNFSVFQIPPDASCVSYWLYPQVSCRFILNFGKCDL